MPIQTVESHRLYRQIADQLSRLIAAGEFTRGCRLPSERELAVLLGVSRASVREALIALEIAGRVEVRVGAGIYVATPKPVAIADPKSGGQGPFELLRARWLIEGEIAANAAREARVEDLVPIRAALEEMQRRERQHREAEAADRSFHLHIAAATHNSALVSVVHDLWDRGRGAVWKRMALHFQTLELRAAALHDHRAIFSTLEARDARGARAAMRRHLERVELEFNRGWESIKERESATQHGDALDATRPGSRRPARSRSF